MEGGDAAASAGWKTGTPWKQKNSEDVPETTGTASPGDVAATRTVSDGSPNKKAGVPAQKSAPPFTGDRTLAQSILFMIDTMLSRDAARAVAAGDVGGLWNDLKIMTFHFEGSSHTKYGGYMLEQTCSLELEASETLRRNFLKNWLVNPSGEPGKTMEGDLFEEHINLELEEAITRKDSGWDDTFLRKVIAPNVNHFIVLKSEWGLGVGLAKRRGHHPEPHSRPEITKLLALYKEEGLHLFRQGRSYKDSQHHVNTYAEGIKNLQKKKLKKFVFNSTRPRVDVPHTQARSASEAETPQRASSHREETQPESRHNGDSEDESSEDESEPEGDQEDDDGVTQLTRGRVDVVDGELLVDYDNRGSGNTGATDGTGDGLEADSQPGGDSSADELANEEEPSDDTDSDSENSD